MPEKEAKQPTVAIFRECIVNEDAPVAKRIHTVFLLRNIGGEEAIEALAAGLASKSVLLSHEIAYVLGQMQDTLAIPYLEATLANLKLDPIVRHEAAEALAAIAVESALPFLEKFVDDKEVEVSDTCKISIDRIKWRMANPELAKKEKEASNYHSVDPAPGHMPELAEKSVEELGAWMRDTSKSLFDRYGAMFALRNRGSDECVKMLATGFGDTSAVFRHEIAYVMGQMQHPVSVDSLTKVLKDEKEHAMVRHEAAEALGSINGVSCDDLLKSYQKDQNVIVKESCDVALSIAEYWTDFNSSGAAAN